MRASASAPLLRRLRREAGHGVCDMAARLSAALGQPLCADALARIERADAPPPSGFAAAVIKTYAPPADLAAQLREICLLAEDLFDTAPTRPEPRADLRRPIAANGEAEIAARALLSDRTPWPRTRRQAAAGALHERRATAVWPAGLDLADERDAPDDRVAYGFGERADGVF